MSQPRPNSNVNPASAPPRYVSGAIDLGDVKAKAQARAQAEAARGQQGAAGVAASGPDAQGVAIERILEINPENFEGELVIRSTQVPVILLLGTPRSEASEALKNAFGRLVQLQDRVQWLFRHVDVDTNGEVAQALGVQTIPTVVALAAGRPLTSFEGPQSEEQLQGWVSAILEAVDGKLAGLPQGAGEGSDQADDGAQGEGDSRFDEAAALLENGDVDGAVAAYDAIIAAEPGNTEVAAEARAARANTLLWQRVNATAAADGSPKALEEAEADVAAAPDDLTAAGVLADLRLLHGDKAGAFDVLIEQIRRHSGEEREQAKQRLLNLFGLFEAADPEVISARTRMASALF